MTFWIFQHTVATGEVDKSISFDEYFSEDFT